MSYGECRNLEAEPGQGSQGRLFPAPSGSSPKRSVDKQEFASDLEIWLWWVGRSRMGEHLQHIVHWLAFTFPLFNSSSELCMLQGDPDSKDSATL